MRYFKSIQTMMLTAGLCLVAARVYAEIQPVSPDNTSKNERDVQAGPLTPEDQSNAQSDIDLTARIRKAIVSDDSFSVNAQNIKIIAIKGRVTLRGPVNSQAEKDKIVLKAQQIAGSENVINQLEVKKTELN